MGLAGTPQRSPAKPAARSRHPFVKIEKGSPGWEFVCSSRCLHFMVALACHRTVYVVPQFKLSQWPQSDEQPVGLFKPAVDARVGLWSPVGLMTRNIFPPGFGALDWGKESVGLAEQLVTGELRYVSELTDDNAFSWFDFWFDISVPGFSPEMRARATIHPPPTSSDPTPVVYEFRQATLLLREETHRTMLYKWLGDIVTQPACDDLVPVGAFEFRALDPLDFDVTPLKGWVVGCDP